MIIEAFVFNGDDSLLHVFGDLLIFHPVTVFFTHQRDQFLILTGTVIIPDGAGLVDAVVAKRDIQLGNKAVFDIVGKDAGKKHPGQEENNDRRPEYFQDKTHHRGNAFHHGVNCFIGKIAHSVRCRALVFCLLLICHPISSPFRNIEFILYHRLSRYDSTKYIRICKRSVIDFYRNMLYYRSIKKWK